MVAKILIVEEQPGMRKILTKLVDKEVGCGKSLQADNEEQVSQVLQAQRVDFAVVSISATRHRSQLAEKIKLCCPNLPVLAVSMGKEQKSSGDKIKPVKSTCELSPQISGRIVAGIRYMRSLSHCGVSGFTVVVKE